MIENRKPMPADWDDDDAPEWTEEMFDQAEFRIGDRIISPGTGRVARPGRPPSPDPKRQVTLRLDRAVLEAFRATGPGWQSRINAELRKALGL
jgi:uncharacterized protein (DUF4415 family)